METEKLTAQERYILARSKFATHIAGCPNCRGEWWLRQHAAPECPKGTKMLAAMDDAKLEIMVAKLATSPDWASR